MPGRVFLTSSMTDVGTSLGVAVHGFADELPRRNISPGEDVVALGPQGLARYRWGIIPVGRKNARGRPVMETIVNARSETVFEKTAFDGVGRAVLPVNGWYEWTGETRRKTAWEISPKSGNFLFFAAITDVWTAPGGAEVHQLATVTCPPNSDLKDIHHRMAVILDADGVRQWLESDQTSLKPLMTSWPDGMLSIRKADPDGFT